MEDLSGQQFGHYQIVQPLGEGGMAAVFKAYQPNMERYVAIKVLPRQLAAAPEFVARFRQEVRVLAQLQHPHILPVFDFGEANGYTYLVMPFVEAGTVAGLLQGRPLPMPQVVSIISQVGDALDYAHTRGLVHRDVKPSNILIDERGNCLLTDFGIAKIMQATGHLTNTGSIIGTPAYMSPEQGRGETIGQASDTYSLGVVLYELVTGRVPYQAETPIAIIFKHVHEPLPPPRRYNPDISIEVEQVILKVLAKLPGDRYGTAGAMVHALQAAVTGAPRGTRPASTPQTVIEPTTLPISSAGLPVERPKPTTSRWTSRRLTIIGAVTLLLGIVGVGVLFMSQQSAALAASRSQTETAAVRVTTPVSVALVAPATLTSIPTQTQLPTSTETPPPTQSPAPMPTPSPTVEASITPVPATATPSCPPVTGTFSAAWTQVRDQIGCATAGEVAGLVVEENFQFGRMIWREPIDFGQALVAFSNGTWATYQHAPYVEGSPEYPCADANTPAQSPPTPRRGFGAMWCDIPAIRNGLGNATDVERGFTGYMRQFADGFMVGTDYGAVFVFYNSGSWERR